MNTGKKIVAGLGNPGKSYEKTPHNAGQNAVLYIAAQYEVDKWSFDRRSQCWCADIISGDGNFLLVIPAGYMNRSGEALKKLLLKRGVLKDLKNEDLIIIHDDIDIPLGGLKISLGGSSGGHNGLRDIINKLGVKDFIRVRMGVSPAGKDGVADKPNKEEVANFLLRPMNFFDRRKLKKIFPDAKKAVSIIARDGYERAMDKFN